MSAAGPGVTLIAGLGADPRPLGGSRLRVGPLGIGTAALSGSYGAPGAERTGPSRAEAARTLEHALRSGVSLIDTAPAYGDSESLVGAVCAGVDCRIATKLAIPEGGWGALPAGAVADRARRSAQHSLEALRRDRIDLLQVHNADAELIRRGEVPAALASLRDDGVALACGATVYGEENALAAIACPAFDVVQIAYSALDRRPERAVLAAAAEHATGLVVRSVLLRGVLSAAGRELAGPFAPLRAAAERFRVAIGASWAELPGAAVAFALTRPGIGCTLLGPRDAGELDALLRGAEPFLERARALSGDWDAGLEPRLLDPSRWAELG